MPARDPLETHAGVVSEAGHTALRADIRRLGDLLGDNLAREEGAHVLALVERVRELSRISADEAGQANREASRQRSSGASAVYSATGAPHTVELSELLSDVEIPTA